MERRESLTANTKVGYAVILITLLVLIWLILELTTLID